MLIRGEGASWRARSVPNREVAPDVVLSRQPGKAPATHAYLATIFLAE
jgi:hypothetical protein